jgi:hypothetical protein
LLSIVAALWLLFKVLVRAISPIKPSILIHPQWGAIANFRLAPQDRHKTIRTHIDAYLLCLLIADVVQGFGAIVNIRWIVAGRTFCGHTCTMQGTMKEIGEVGVALLSVPSSLGLRMYRSHLFRTQHTGGSELHLAIPKTY